MPSRPQPFWRDTSLMIQLVTEPTVETPTLRPLRSSTVLMLSSLRTTSANRSGGPAIAAMPFTGEPLTMKASPGPEPSAMSIPSAAIACCSFASPPKLAISTSSPWRRKMPVRTPMSAGTNENASRPALPTRRVSAEAEERPSNATVMRVRIVRISLPGFFFVGWAKARNAPCPRVFLLDYGGHASLNPPYGSSFPSYRIPRPFRRGLVQRQIVPQHHAVVVARRGCGDELLQHVVARRRRVALERVAESAAAAGAHDHLGAHRHRHVAARRRLELVLARQPHQVVAELAGLAAPQPPGWAFLPPRVLEIPL